MRKNRLWLLIALVIITLTLIPGRPLPVSEARRADCTSVISALGAAVGQCQSMVMGKVCNGHNNVTVSPQQNFGVSTKLLASSLSGLTTQATGPGVALMLLGGQHSVIKLVFFGDTRVTQMPTSNSNATLRASLGRGLLCDNTRSGITIQNRQGEVGTITINGVLIQISSTAAITMESDTSGSVTYYSDQDGEWDIFTLDTATGQSFNLTNNTSNDIHPSYSPDGGSIVFQSDRTGNNELFVMNPSGGNVRQITFDGAFVGHPNWSSTGWIAFDSTAYGSRDIVVVDTNGGSRRNLTNSAASVENIWPVWSPDGQWIAFYSDRDGDRDIYVMDSNGGSLRQLTYNTADDRYPAWSPDGSRIVYASTQDGNWELYTMDPYGNGVERLTNNGGTDWGASYTPDGGQILFTSDRDGDNELYVMNAGGGAPTQLTFNGNRDELPVWRGAGGGVDHWMVVTNMGGSVAVGPGLTPIAPGQQIRIAMDRAEQPTRYEAPSTSGMTYASPVVQAIRDTILPTVQDATIY